VRTAWREWRNERGARAKGIAIPIETEPGEIARVDFGYVYPSQGVGLRDGARVLLADGGRVVFDQKIETWLLLHVCHDQD